METKKYKVWYWKDGVESILYEGTFINRAVRTAKMWRKHIQNVETNFGI